MNSCPDQSPPTPLLRLESISKAFGQQQVLSDVTLELHTGEIVALLGISGSGKSTLFNIIAGLLKADRGRVLLDGRDITGSSGQVAYMLQKDLLLPHMSILDNVALPLLIRRLPKGEAREQARLLLPEFGLEEAGDKYPAEVSGGMAQRAALLRTYLFSKRLALLDEPFSALDALTKAQVHDWFLKVMHDIGMTVLLITHDMDEALKLSDRILIMAGRSGRLGAELIIAPEHRRLPDFVLQREFLDYKKRLTELLEKQA